MSEHGVTVQAEIQKLKDDNDALLDKLISVVAERDLAQEKLAFVENELISCYEASGRTL